MSFADTQDFEDIVMTILWFSGPCHRFLPVWAPTEQMIIQTMNEERRQLGKYMLRNVRLLDSQHSLWGRRTAVWSCEIDPTASQQGRSRMNQGENLIIKLSWNISRLRQHEQNVYRHIMEKQQQGVVLGEKLHIPTPIGFVYSSSISGKDHPVDIADWRTRPAMMTDESGEEYLQATTLVTKCKKAVEVFGLKMQPKAFLCYFRRFFSMLRYLATCEIHYRDVNPGNILCDAETHSICILADFDFSRIGMLPRGSKDNKAKPLSPYQASLDDSISGSLYFMCRRVQKILALRAEFDNVKARVLASERMCKEDPSSLDAAEQHEDDKRRLEKVLQEITTHYHTYIDDAESTVYNMLWIVSLLRLSTTGWQRAHASFLNFFVIQVAFMQTPSLRFPPPSLRSMHIPSAKQDIWETVWVVSSMASR